MTALVVIILYLVMLLGLGWLSNTAFRGTSRDYMLASHTIGPFFLLMSLFGTTMTSFALVGSTGAAYMSGAGIYAKLASASGIVHSLCFFLVGVPLWRLGRRHGFTTQIQFFRERLNSNGIGILLFPVLVGLVIPYLLIGILGAGAVVNGITAGTFPNVEAFAAYRYGVPPQLASLVISVVVMLYVFFGGMRGTAWANALQTMIFMILGIVTFVVIAYRIGKEDTLLESMRQATSQVDPDHLTRAKIAKLNYASYLLIPLSVAMFPHVFQHWLTARSASSFKLPIVAHPIFIMIVWLPCVLIGVWASGLTHWSHPVPSNQVLARLVQDAASPLLGGLLTAGILAAIMSSLDSQFLCLGTMFTNDVALRLGRAEEYTERGKVLLARLFVIGVVALTYAISRQIVLAKAETSVFVMGIWCFSGFTGLFPLVVAALYWRRLTVAGAYASVLVTAAVWGYLFYQSDFGQNRAYGFPVPDLLPVVTILASSTVALILVSLMTRPPDKAVLDRFFDRSP